MSAYLCLLGAAFLWGSSFVAGKFALGLADAPLVVLARFLIASLFWLPAALRAARALPRSSWPGMAGLAFLMIPATFLLQFIGLQYTSAGSAAIMIGFEPLMIVLVGWLIWNQRPTAVNIVCGLTAMAGVALAMGKPRGAGFAGCALVLLSTAVVAIWVRWSAVWLKRLPTTAFSALTTVLGTLMLVPCALLLSKDSQLHYSAGGAAALLYLGIGCSLLAGWLWNLGMRHCNANAGGLFLALEPVFGVALAALLLGEPLRGPALAGIVLVIVPVLASSMLQLLRPRQLSTKESIQ